MDPEAAPSPPQREPSSPGAGHSPTVHYPDPPSTDMSPTEENRSNQECLQANRSPAEIH